MKPTQNQMYEMARKKAAAEADELFLELVDEGMTAAELQTNINRRPELWGRYDHWVEELP